jgi:acyl-CoA synthetase (AMP-forming)/AMP-acid ligase II
MTVRQILGDHDTLPQVLQAAAQVNGHVDAFLEVAEPGSPGVVPAGPDGRRRLTYEAWESAAAGVAGHLSDLGVGRGDVVALLLPSSIDYAVCYQAVARLGAVTTGLNLRLGAAERSSILARVHPTVTVVDTAEVAPDELPTSAGHLVHRRELAAAAAVDGPAVAVTDPSDPVAIVWTSGSTGHPKGAVFDHRNLAAVARGTDVLSHDGARRLSPLPFAHVAFMTRPWDEIGRAMTTVITPQPWSAADAIRLMAEEAVTVGQGVPTQWALILRHESLARADLSSLRIIGTGAARVPAELVGALRARFGCPVVVRYTSTETSLGTGTRPDDPDDVVATTVGRPVPGVEIELADEDGRPVEPGDVGRVRLRSAASMRGYVRSGADGPLVDPEATTAVRAEDGWITTGDMGWVGPDGNLRLVGRATEMYIRGGYNVYPAEVEGVLGAHPHVVQAAVLGVPDDVLGEIGVAFVVPTPGAEPSLQELREFCRASLADYKAPDRLHLIDELPLSAMAKVDKRVLALRAGAPDPVSGVR